MPQKEPLQEAVEDLNLPTPVESWIKEQIQGEKPIHRKIRMFLGKQWKKFNLGKKASDLFFLYWRKFEDRFNEEEIKRGAEELGSVLSYEMPDNIMPRGQLENLAQKRLSTTNEITAFKNKNVKTDFAKFVQDEVVDYFLSEFSNRYKKVAEILNNQPRLYKKLKKLKQKNPELKLNSAKKTEDILNKFLIMQGGLNKEEEVVEFSDGSKWIGPVEDKQFIVEVGQELQNCLKNNPGDYAGRTFVYLSSQNKPKIAASFVEEKIAGQFYINQVRGKQNKFPKEKYWDKLFAFLGEVGTIFKDNAVSSNPAFKEKVRKAEGVKNYTSLSPAEILVKELISLEQRMNSKLLDMQVHEIRDGTPKVNLFATLPLKIFSDPEKVKKYVKSNKDGRTRWNLFGGTDVYDSYYSPPEVSSEINLERTVTNHKNLNVEVDEKEIHFNFEINHYVDEKKVRTVNEVSKIVNFYYEVFNHEKKFLENIALAIKKDMDEDKEPTKIQDVLEEKIDDIRVGGHTQDVPPEKREDYYGRVTKVNRPTDSIIVRGLFESDKEKHEKTCHLFQDLSLTLENLKEALKKLASGEIRGIERIEGYTFYFTLGNNKIRIARNKSEARNGGLPLVKLKNKPYLKKCRYLLRKLEKKIYNTQNMDRFEDVFFKTTFNSKRSNDSYMSYGKDIFTVHRFGHFVVQENNKSRLLSKRKSKEYSQYLGKLLSQIDFENSVNIRFSALRSSPQYDNPQKLEECLLGLSEAFSAYDLDESDTLFDYATSRMEHLIKIGADLSSEEIDNSIDYILKDKSAEIPEKIKNHARSLLEKTIEPIQHEIRKFTSSLLNTMESSYVEHDEDISLQNIEDLVDKISDYKGENYKQAYNYLNKYLKNIRGNLPEKIKSFVFQFESKPYKISGNYQPTKNIVNLFYSGKKEVPPIKNLFKENKAYFRTQGKHQAMAGDEVAVIPGAFKPPHAGHYDLVHHMADMRETNGNFTVDEVFVMISPGKRVGHSSDNRVEFTAELSARLWEIYAGKTSRIEHAIADYKSPMRNLFYFMEEHLQEGDTMWVAQGEKENNQNKIEKLRDYSEVKGLNVRVKVEETDLYNEGISSTQMRHWFAQGNYDQFKEFLPDHLTSNMRERIVELIRDAQPKKKFLNEMKIPLVEGAGGETSHVASPPVVRGKSQPQMDDPKSAHNVHSQNEPHSGENEERPMYEDEEEEKNTNQKVQQIKSLKKKRKKIKEKLHQSDRHKDEDDIESYNTEIEEINEKIKQLKGELKEYYLNSFSELNISEISGMGAGAVAGNVVANSQGSGHGQNREAAMNQSRNSRGGGM